MKVLLLSPPSHFNRPTTLPLGVCCISAYLNERGIEAKAYDCFDYSFSDVEKLIKKENPDVVGISCFTNLRTEAKKIAEITRRINPEINIVMGGTHASALPGQMLKYTDFIVHREGEGAMYNLIQNLNKPQRVKGVSFLTYDGTITTEPQPFIDNLDDLPFPDISNVIDNEYTKVTFQKGEEKTTIKGNHFSMNTSRGCAFNCQFCSTPRFWGRRWRAKSVERVKAEMKILHDKDIEHIYFLDDTFTVNQKRTIKLCNDIKDLGMTYNCETRVDCVNRELLKALKDSGCIWIKYGIESGSPTILKNINKGITVKQIVKAFKLTKEVDIPTQVFLMVGNPGETEKTVEETANLLKKIKPDEICCALTLVYPNTALYELSKSQGFMDDSYWLTDKDPPVYTVEHNTLELRKLQYKVVRGFMETRPIQERAKFYLEKMSTFWRYFQRKRY